jgi:hypothetical protein
MPIRYTLRHAHVRGDNLDTLAERRPGMAGEQTGSRSCDSCGATIQREHLLDHSAARYKGQLLCPECVQKVKAKIAAAKRAETASETPQDPTDEPIALVEVELPSGDPETSSQIHGFSGGATALQPTEREYKRHLLRNTQAATRCRTFHCKMTDASFVNLNDQINEWADDNEDVEIKFAISNVGVVEGKHADPHLIITVFY